MRSSPRARVRGRPSYRRGRNLTPERFWRARHVARLTQPQAAELLGVSLRTVRNWESGRTRIPYAAYKLMRVLRGGEIPGDAWAGYRVHGDTLWTPEGRPIRAWESRWWGLLVAQARQFRRLYAQRRGHFRAAPSSGLVHIATSRKCGGRNPASAPESRMLPHLLVMPLSSIYRPRPIRSRPAARSWWQRGTGARRSRPRAQETSR